MADCAASNGGRPTTNDYFGEKGSPMKFGKATFIIPTVLAMSVFACGFGPQAPALSPVDQAATIVAMTMEAYGASTATGPTSAQALASPVAATPTATTKPTLSINTNDAKCRSGPSTNADVFASYTAGTTVDLVAQDSADGFWLVVDPGSGSSCWVRTQDASAAGSYDLLPELTPQAEANAGQDAPAKPGSSANFNYWEYTCGVGSVTVTLRWIDSATNESGYHIYRSGTLVADLPPGSTSYSETYNGGGSLSYSIRAYNSFGESPALSTPSFSC
jgi:hypothetical protein